MRVFLGGRWVGLVLVASLALNLFLAGVVGARYWREYWRDGQQRATMGLGSVGRVASAVPEAARAKVKAVIDARQQELRDKGRDYRQSRQSAIQTLTAEPFDRAKADAAFAEALRKGEVIAVGMQGALIDAVGLLTPDERKAFRERLAERDRERERRGPPPQR